MARTKYEIEAIADAIHSEITKKQAEQIKAVRKEARQIFVKEYKPLFKKIDDLEKRAEAVKKRIKTKVFGSPNSWRQLGESTIREQLEKNLAKIKTVSKETVEREVILAGDSSADVLIKNITKMFV